jgi:hypothetical protein
MSRTAENEQALSELIESIVSTPAAAPRESEVQGVEAREFPRFAFRGRAQAVVLAPQGDEEPQESEVVTTDVSRTGLNLLHRKQLQPGQQILLVLSDGNRLVEVCWCCRVWPGLYSVGCRFVGVAPATEATDTSRN